MEGKVEDAAGDEAEDDANWGGEPLEKDELLLRLALEVGGEEWGEGFSWSLVKSRGGVLPLGGVLLGGISPLSLALLPLTLRRLSLLLSDCTALDSDLETLFALSAARGIMREPLGEGLELLEQGIVPAAAGGGSELVLAPAGNITCSLDVKKRAAKI